MRWWPLLAFGFACTPTETIVELETDIEAIDRYTVDITGMGTQRTLEIGRTTSIVSFGLRPKDGDRSRRIELRVRGFDGEEELVSERRFLDGFEKGRRRVTIFVSSVCDPPDEDIDLGEAAETGCMPEVDAGTDGGSDAGVEDAELEDAEPSDIGVEPEVITAFSIGGFRADQAGQIAFDTMGNVVVAGTFMVAFVLTPTVTLSALGTEDIYVAKFSPQGMIIWWRQLEGNGTDVGGLQIDQTTDEIVIGGSFLDSLVLDEVVLLQNSSLRTWGFVLSLDGEGRSPRAVALPASGYLAVRDLARDEASGRVYVAGAVDGAVQIDACTVADSGSIDGYVMALTDTLACDWARTVSSTASDSINAVDVAPPDRVYGGGYYGAEVRFPGTALPSLPDLDPRTTMGVVLELSAEDGEATAAIGFRTSPSVYAIHAQGGRILVGGPLGDSPLSGMRSTASGTSSIAGGTVGRAPMVEVTPGLASLMPVEVPLGNAGRLQTNAIRLDERGGWLAGGSFNDAFVPHQSVGNVDPVLLMLDGELQVRHAIPIPESGSNTVASVAYDPARHVFAVLGPFSGSFELAGRTLTSSGSTDLYLMTGRW